MLQFPFSHLFYVSKTHFRGYLRHFSFRSILHRELHFYIQSSGYFVFWQSEPPLPLFDALERSASDAQRIRCLLYLLFSAILYPTSCGVEVSALWRIRNRAYWPFCATPSLGAGCFPFKPENAMSAIPWYACDTGASLISKGGQNIRLTTCLTTSGAKLNNQKSGISAVGSALALGARCREFESPISDHCRQNLRIT